MFNFEISLYDESTGPRNPHLGRDFQRSPDPEWLEPLLLSIDVESMVRQNVRHNRYTHVTSSDGGQNSLGRVSPKRNYYAPKKAG